MSYYLDWIEKNRCVPDGSGCHPSPEEDGIESLSYSPMGVWEWFVVDFMNLVPSFVVDGILDLAAMVQGQG